MKLHPIILTTQDVQALIEGRKTRHTVLVKFRNKKWRLSYEANEEGRTDLDAFGVNDELGNLIELTEGSSATLDELGLSPFGSPGDAEWQTGMPPVDGMYWVDGYTIPIKYTSPKFWESNSGIRWKRMGSILVVKETFYAGYKLDENDNIPDGAELEYWYYANHKGDNRPGGVSDEWCYHMYGNDKECWPRWKSPATMPREASRIYLEVTGVTCQRVHQISTADCFKEGAPQSSIPFDENHKGDDQHTWYKKYWIDRHGPDSWNNNSWAFSCNWKVLSTTGKPNYLWAIN